MHGLFASSASGIFCMMIMSLMGLVVVTTVVVVMDGATMGVAVVPVFVALD